MCEFDQSPITVPITMPPNGEHGGGDNGYVVVGAAHVGTQALLEHVLGDEPWTRIEIC